MSDFKTAIQDAVNKALPGEMATAVIAKLQAFDRLEREFENLTAVHKNLESRFKDLEVLNLHAEQIATDRSVLEAEIADFEWQKKEFEHEKQLFEIMNTQALIRLEDHQKILELLLKKGSQ